MGTGEGSRGGARARTCSPFCESSRRSYTRKGITSNMPPSSRVNRSRCGRRSICSSRRKATRRDGATARSSSSHRRTPLPTQTLRYFEATQRATRVLLPQRSNSSSTAEASALSGKNCSRSATLPRSSSSTEEIDGVTDRCVSRQS